MRRFRKLLFVVSVFIGASVNAQSWSLVGRGVNEYVGALLAYDSVLYAGGYFTIAGGSTANHIAQWDGTNWSSLGTGLDNSSSNALALAIYEDKLYAAGDIFSADGIPANHIASWDGSQWDSVGSGVGFSNNSTAADALAVYNGELYAGGQFTIAGGVSGVNNIARWNGTRWDSVGKGIEYNALVYSLCVYNGELYVGGWFDSAGGIHTGGIARWNGTRWDSVGLWTWGDRAVAAMTVFNGRLYAGGTGGSYGFIASWDGSNWDTLGRGLNEPVYSLTSFNGNIYAGGLFDSAGGQQAYKIARWDGSDWSAIGNGMNNAVVTEAIYDSTLFIGGAFDSSGLNPLNYVAEWNTITSINKVGEQNNIQIYPNPSNGNFTLVLSNSNKDCNVEIYNVLGEKVLTETPVRTGTGGLHSVQGDNRINLTGQPNGIYFYRVLQQDGSLVGSGKFVIDK